MFVGFNSYIYQNIQNLSMKCYNVSFFKKISQNNKYFISISIKFCCCNEFFSFFYIFIVVKVNV